MESSNLLSVCKYGALGIFQQKKDMSLKINFHVSSLFWSNKKKKNNVDTIK